MAVAIIQARLAGMTFARIAHKKRLTLLALLSHRVVVALEANIQPTAGLAVRMTIAQTLDATIGAHVAKVALALIRTYAISTDTSLAANRQAGTLLLAVSLGTDALVSHCCVQIDALFRHSVTVVMAIDALILRRTLHIVPGHNISMG